jgi:hypothetical protein
MNSSFISSSLPFYGLIEQFEEGVDALHELAPDLRPRSFYIVHGYPA